MKYIEEFEDPCGNSDPYSIHDERKWECGCGQIVIDMHPARWESLETGEKFSEIADRMAWEMEMDMPEHFLK